MIKNWRHPSGDYEIKLSNNYFIERANSREIMICDSKRKVIIWPLLRQILVNGDYVYGFVEPNTDNSEENNDAGYFILNTRRGIYNKNLNRVDWLIKLKEQNIKIPPVLITLDDFVKRVDRENITKL
jgi:hypothetical protein